MASWLQSFNLILFCLFTNIVVYFISLYSFDSRPYFLSLDYAFISLILAIVKNFVSVRSIVLSITIMLMFIAMGADLLAVSYKALRFDIEILISYLHFIGDWPQKMHLDVALLVVFTFMLVLVLSLGHQALLSGKRNLAMLALFCFVSLGVDITTGRSLFRQADISDHANVVSSPVVTILLPIISHKIEKNGALRPLVHAKTFNDQAIEPWPGRVLMIGVESWGMFNDPVYNERMLNEAKKAVGKNYRLSLRESHVFRGYTLAAEIRELCGLQLIGGLIEVDRINKLKKCVPARLSAANIQTIAIHGNDGGFYERDKIYPAMGFKEVLFFPELSQHGGKICNADFWAGICDKDVLHQALTKSAETSRNFIYVMSLDTHLPLSRHMAHNCQNITEGIKKELCVYQENFTLFFNTLAGELARAPQAPDRVILFGDHKPPFFKENTQSAFNSKNVPFLVFDRNPGLASPH